MKSVHPHARGDSAISAAISAAVRGPSPRAWGFPRRLARQRYLGRSIPTRVGIPRPRGARWHRGAVHPHARGDSSMTRPTPYSASGPSPRAWGFRTKSRRARFRFGSIPTRVGIPRTSWIDGRFWPVHPHARGDSEGCAESQWRPRGPSPRAWGFLCTWYRNVNMERSIPTRVGIPLLFQVLLRPSLQSYSPGTGSRRCSISVRPSKSRGRLVSSPAHRMAKPCSVCDP